MRARSKSVILLHMQSISLVSLGVISETVYAHGQLTFPSAIHDVWTAVGIVVVIRIEFAKRLHPFDYCRASLTKG